MLLILALFLGMVFSPIAVRADDPEVTITRLINPPNRMFYFDDTPVSLAGQLLMHPLM